MTITCSVTLFLIHIYESFPLVSSRSESRDGKEEEERPKLSQFRWWPAESEAAMDVSGVGFGRARGVRASG